MADSKSGAEISTTNFFKSDTCSNCDEPRLFCDGKFNRAEAAILVGENVTLYIAAILFSLTN